MRKRLVQVAVMALCLISFAGFAQAQVYTGRIDITAKDGTGAVLPGVTVDLVGVQAGNAVTDSRGEAHFLNLPPGKYAVTAKLSGFNNYKNDNVPVGAGSVVPLTVTLTVGNVATSVEVKAETPVLETKKVAVQTNVSLDELQGIPTSRDPWVILQTVPGVIVDRVNVGGAESGQQSNFQAKGARGGDNTWNMDGVPITDMAALGCSPTYYDFDMFQEMQVTTGGADVTTGTPGAGMNFVLRSGTNRFRGSARYYFENDGMQSDNVSAAIVGQVCAATTGRPSTSIPASRSAGPSSRTSCGPGARMAEPSRTIESTRIPAPPGRRSRTAPTAARRRSSEPSRRIRPCSMPSARTTARSSRTRRSRSTGTSTRRRARRSRTSVATSRSSAAARARRTPTRRPGIRRGRPRCTKARSTAPCRTVSFLTGRYAYITGGFSLTPRGASDVTAFQDDNGVWHGNYLSYSTDRPQQTAQLEGTSFKGMHELKFGFGWRKANVSSETSWPGGLYAIADGYPNVTATVARPVPLHRQRRLLERLCGRHDHQGSLHVQPRRAVGPSSRAQCGDLGSSQPT